MDETCPPGHDPGRPQCENHPGTEAVSSRQERSGGGETGWPGQPGRAATGSERLGLPSDRGQCPGGILDQGGERDPVADVQAVLLVDRAVVAE